MQSGILSIFGYAWDNNHTYSKVQEKTFNVLEIRFKSNFPSTNSGDVTDECCNLIV